MSKTVVDRLEDMGKKIDDLEKSIGELINESGMEEGLVSGKKEMKQTNKDLEEEEK